MVPGSTFRYGSHFWMVILKPRLSRRQPIEEAATPLPREETTPPVTKIYFGAIRTSHAPWRNGARENFSPCAGCTCSPLRTKSEVKVQRILRAAFAPVNSRPQRLPVFLI